MALKISKINKPKGVRKTSLKSSGERQKKKLTLRDFYGALKDTYGDALAYQKKIRDEW
jgi:hypothetical protein